MLIFCVSYAPRSGLSSLNLPIPPSVPDVVSFRNVTSPTGASLSARLGITVELDDVTTGSLFISCIIFFSRILTICCYKQHRINK